LLNGTSVGSSTKWKFYTILGIVVGVFEDPNNIYPGLVSAMPWVDVFLLLSLAGLGWFLSLTSLLRG
jgi:hypothetical protein